MNIFKNINFIPSTLFGLVCVLIGFNLLAKDASVEVPAAAKKSLISFRDCLAGAGRNVIDLHRCAQNISLVDEKVVDLRHCIDKERVLAVNRSPFKDNSGDEDVNLSYECGGWKALVVMHKRHGVFNVHEASELMN